MGEPGVVAHHEVAELELLVQLAGSDGRRLVLRLVHGQQHLLAVAAGPVLGGRDDEVDLHLGAGHRLQRLLDQTGESVLQPVLGQLAGDADAEDASFRREQGGVLQPGFVARLRQLEPELVLYGDPDLVRSHFASTPRPLGTRPSRLWTKSVRGLVPAPRPGRRTAAGQRLCRARRRAGENRALWKTLGKTVVSLGALPREVWKGCG